MARYADGKLRRSAVFALQQNCWLNSTLAVTLWPQIFAYSRWHHLWLQNGVVCVVICVHLNMLWICFVFIQENMRAGVAVEPWETCFLIWFNCFCCFNACLYLASEASKMHEILQRPSEHLNARICQIEHDFVNLWQRYWPNTTSCRVNTETMCVCDFTSKLECHSSFKYAYILLKHLNITLQLILLLDSAHIVFWWP